MAPSHENASRQRLFNKKKYQPQSTSDPTDSPSSAASHGGVPPKNNTGDTQAGSSQNTAGAAINGNSNNHHRLDNYGFIVNMDSRGKVLNQDDYDSDADDNHDYEFKASTASKDVPSFKEYQTTQRREKKWGNMMVRWVVPEPVVQTGQKAVQTGKQAVEVVVAPLTPERRKPLSDPSDVQPPQQAGRVRQNHHRRKVITRLRKGVPDHMRGQVWQYLCRVPQRMKTFPGKYKELVAKAIAQHEEAAHHSEQQRLLLSKQQDEQTTKQSAATSQSSGSVPSNAPYIVRHAKSFKNIQDTIERDIHRTYPRHHLFFEESEASVDDNDLPLENSNDPRMSSASTASDDAPSLRTRQSRIGEEKETDPPPSPSLLQRNPALRRSHSPQEAPHRPVGSVEEEDGDDCHNGNNHSNTGVAEMDVGVESSLAFCGPNEEISNMIRELEGVVVGDSPTHAAEPVVTPPSNPHAAIPHNVLPARVADAVGGQASLRRVLKAYSVYDREVGYCQGMNFVAGMFLTLMPEEESFWLLVSVMNDPPTRMRGLFGEGMKETHLVLYVAEQLIRYYLPKLYQHLEDEHVHITMFATQWLLTQYTSSFKFDLVLRVWDAFLGEGWKVTYRVMLAILKLHEATILASSFEEILTLFREVPDRVHGQTVMEAAMKIPLRRLLIHKFEQDWYAQQKAEHQQQQQQRSSSMSSPSGGGSVPSGSSKTNRNKKKATPTKQRSNRNQKNQ